MEEQHECYVCKEKINSGGECVILIRDTLMRHTDCEPGSSKWLDSEVGKNSALRGFFNVFDGETKMIGYEKGGDD